MSQSKTKKTDVLYRTEDIIKSNKFKEYQQDFMRAILVKPAYTLSDAKRLLDRILKGGN